VTAQPFAPAAVVSFARNLDSFGDRPALVTPAGTVSYRELAARVAALRARLAGERRLVLLRGSNTVGTIANYLAALSAGHAVLIAPADKPISWLTDAGYDPDIVLTDGAIERVRERPRYPIHPDLALLLSTSGSTGSAKLVRLSRENLEANAESIASYLEITANDRAVTTLPMHYCYGLSVIHSYLLRGASLLLTDASVADHGFWDAVRTHHVTSFAGVPHTFELLDRIGFDRMDLPDLRYVTQAGGRMLPERVRSYAASGRRRGWRLFVMYGQTEATARMAYLPPDLAEEHSGCVGVAIPGGRLWVEPLPDSPDPWTGELVYAGPNVMMGYAEGPADLAQGRVVTELRTGDLARVNQAGLIEIVGRRSRFVKLFGLRIDLQQTEELLAAAGHVAACVGDDNALQIAVVGSAHASETVRRLVAQRFGLPGHAIAVCAVSDLPRLESGKPDYVRVRQLFDRTPPPADGSAPAPGAPSELPANLRSLFAQVLDRADVTVDDTFVSLGGDSLSYVEMTIRLERALGTLPANWHVTPIRELNALTAPPRRWWSRIRRIETSVAIRAVAIIMILGGHVGAIPLEGSAYALFAVAGYNFGRFTLAAADRISRVRSLAATIARIVAISLPVILTVSALIPEHYSITAFFDANHIEHSSDDNHQESEYWFIVMLVYVQLAVLALIAIPGMHRLERASRFALPMTLVTIALHVRYENIPVFIHALRPELEVPFRELFWLFPFGWAIAQAKTVWQRVGLTAILVTVTWGVMEVYRDDAVVIAYVVVLIWLPWLPSTRLINRVAGAIAASTLSIYLLHWQIFPVLQEHGLDHPVVLIVICLAAGVAYFQLAERMIALVTRALRPRRPLVAANAGKHRDAAGHSGTFDPVGRR
jgi:acyl-CoA synthetase (AMP-forming)/AMP-acid ligase II